MNGEDGRELPGVPEEQGSKSEQRRRRQREERQGRQRRRGLSKAERNEVTERRRREGGRSKRQREMKREEKIKVSEWGTGDRPSSSKAVPVSLASLGTARDTETMRTGRRTLKKPFPLHRT